MLSKKITSVQHPRVQEAIEIRRLRSARQEKKIFLLVGQKMIQEYQGPLLTVFSLQESPLKAKEHFIVPEEILKKITGLEKPDGMAAIVSLPPPKDPFLGERLLVLDGLQDPGNVGTLLRTAWAFGWDGVVATPDTVDFFNDKALRAARGATLHLPLATLPEEAILEKLNRPLYIADFGGTLPTSYSPPLALLLGREGEGVRSWAKNKGKRLTIPMSHGVDSLNVATAGALFLYMMRHPL